MIQRPVHSRVLVTVVLALVVSGCAGGDRVPRPFPTAGPPDEPSDTEEARRAPRGESVIDTALALQGTPYREGGADRSGFDCSGLVSYVFGQHGLSLPRNVADLFDVGSPVSHTDLRPGDLLFFQTVSRGPSHVGIALGDDRFIHAPSSGGQVRIEWLGGSYWKRRYFGARRVTRAP